MAIISCKECSGKMSDMAESCPHCGAPAHISIEKDIPKANCFECNAELEADVEICPSCGVNQSLKSKVKAEQKVSDQKQEEKKSSPPPKEEPKGQKPEPQVIYVKEPKKKWGAFKILLLITGIIAIIAIVIFNVLPDDAKRELYYDMGIENTDFVKDHGLNSYISVQDWTTTKTILGKVKVNATLYNRHPTATIKTLRLKFEFSDGSEERTINKSIPPGNDFPRFVNEKFNGHKNASLRSITVIEARDY